MAYTASPDRYSSMTYRRCGRSGIRLPLVSLGLWHNFGSVDPFENSRKMMLRAFDLGITHFDLANNYGPVPGSAEETFGKVISSELAPYRDEIIVSTKAGYLMWDGPYGEWGSRKNLIASCNQSLKRMKLDYVDIFYSHRVDPETPLEETMGALATIVGSGKALYAGISNYPAETAAKAIAILKDMKVPCLIHQMRYNIFSRSYDKDGLFNLLVEKGVGGIAFSPLAQGLLSDKYLKGIPEGSRATREHFLKSSSITPELLTKIMALNDIAARRGQTLPQMAVAWILNRPGITSALIGARTTTQIEDVAAGLSKLSFSEEELSEIDRLG